MKISEMLYDAARYPFSGLKQLLLLGLLILISSLFLGQYNELYVYLDKQHKKQTLQSVLKDLLACFIPIFCYNNHFYDPGSGLLI
jgi:hypothetical protein